MTETSGPGLAYKPKRVITLFVGESSPAQGTHFYRADSNLFRAIRSAFAVAFGETAIGEGEAFLRAFKARGCCATRCASTGRSSSQSWPTF